MRLRLAGMSHYRGTMSGLSELWQRGEVRDLPDESAAYLLETFPGVFVLVADAPEIVTPTLSAPPVSRRRR